MDKDNNDSQPSAKLFCGNLAPEVDEQELRDIFRVYGEVKDVKVINKAGNCFAFIEFCEVRDAQDSLKENNRELHGKPIRLEAGNNGKKRRNEGCYSCGSLTHFAKDCTVGGGRSNYRSGGASYSSGGGSSSSAPYRQRSRSNDRYTSSRRSRSPQYGSSSSSYQRGGESSSRGGYTSRGNDYNRGSDNHQQQSRGGGDYSRGGDYNRGGSDNYRRHNDGGDDRRRSSPVRSERRYDSYRSGADDAPRYRERAAYSPSHSQSYGTGYNAGGYDRRPQQRRDPSPNPSRAPAAYYPPPVDQSHLQQPAMQAPYQKSSEYQRY